MNEREPYPRDSNAGVLVAAASCTLDSDGHCITCSDEALPARVLQVDEATGLAIVAIDGATTEVDISLVDAVQVGQLLLVHGGVAISTPEAEQ
ncbi:MAG: HypC/HybG/HupF family hydrogenase formation chaperone [Herpetosiphonaceae bacterium]|nr:HypC/HybG/HupF family hydrogenase formation chaperone [Herpetosiphonaceae bacterium]